MQSFWFGPITTMERLSVASFLAHGHEVHVYSHGEVVGLPEQVVVKDAGEVLPPRSRLRSPVYRDSHRSFSSYANMFRYKLLLERGGWWIDLDTVCLKPFDLVGEYIFATEPDQTVASAVFRVPAGSDLMAYAYERCVALGKERRQWGTTGPRLLREAVEHFGLESFAVDASVFIPVDWPEWESYLDPDRVWQFEPQTRALHLWNSLWVKAGRDRNATYPPTCLYEILKKQYLG
jgi:hypothetical protein